MANSHYDVDILSSPNIRRYKYAPTAEKVMQQINALEDFLGMADKTTWYQTDPTTGQYYGDPWVSKVFHMRIQIPGTATTAQSYLRDRIDQLRSALGAPEFDWEYPWNFYQPLAKTHAFYARIVPTLANFQIGDLNCGFHAAHWASLLEAVGREVEPVGAATRRGKVFRAEALGVWELQVTAWGGAYATTSISQGYTVEAGSSGGRFGAWIHTVRQWSTPHEETVVPAVAETEYFGTVYVMDTVGEGFTSTANDWVEAEATDSFWTDYAGANALNPGNQGGRKRSERAYAKSSGQGRAGYYRSGIQYPWGKGLPTYSEPIPRFSQTDFSEGTGTENIIPEVYSPEIRSADTIPASFSPFTSGEPGSAKRYVWVAPDPTEPNRSLVDAAIAVYESRVSALEEIGTGAWLDANFPATPPLAPTTTTTGYGDGAGQLLWIQPEDIYWGADVSGIAQIRSEGSIRIENVDRRWRAWDRPYLPDSWPEALTP